MRLRGCGSRRLEKDGNDATEDGQKGDTDRSGAGSDRGRSGLGGRGGRRRNDLVTTTWDLLLGLLNLRYISLRLLNLRNLVLRRLALGGFVLGLVTTVTRLVILTTVAGLVASVAGVVTTVTGLVITTTGDLGGLGLSLADGADGGRDGDSLSDSLTKGAVSDGLGALGDNVSVGGVDGGSGHFALVTSESSGSRDGVGGRSVGSSGGGGIGDGRGVRGLIIIIIAVLVALLIPLIVEVVVASGDLSVTVLDGETSGGSVARENRGRGGESESSANHCV